MALNVLRRAGKNEVADALAESAAYGVLASEAPSTEPKCNPHPDAPHGFNRNASHNAGRYVCDCEGWEPDGVAMPSAPADPIMDVVEQIAQQWDGCTHEASGIEIGEAIRSAGIRLTLGVKGLDRG